MHRADGAIGEFGTDDEAVIGIEHVLADAAVLAGIPVSIVQPQRVRSFARSLGRLAKSDPIDAALIAEFTAAFDNIDKARLVPDWAALGLAPEKPGQGKKQTNKPTNKPAADKPTPAE